MLTECVVCWCSGGVVGFATESLWVRLLAFLLHIMTLESCSRICVRASVSKKYNLILVQGWRWAAAGKLTSVIILSFHVMTLGTWFTHTRAFISKHYNF